MRRRGQGRLSRFQVGLIALARARDRHLSSRSRGTSRSPSRTRSRRCSTTPARMGLNSPVRIAGVNVGKVSKVETADDDSTASVVTMKINDEALPIHEDAELKIRPRIFFGGNFFVDLRPGTPGAERAGLAATRSRRRRPARRCSSTRCSAALRADTRKDLQKLLEGYGEAIAGEPAPGEDDDQDPDTQGETAGKSLNDSLEYAPDALRGTAIVNEATPGHRAARPVQADRRRPEGLGGAGQPRDPAQGPDLQLQHHHRRAGRRAGQPAPDHPLLPAGAGRGQPGLRQPQRLVPAHARVRPRDHPGRPRDARPRSRRRCRGSRRPASSSPRPSSRACGRPAAGHRGAVVHAATASMSFLPQQELLNTLHAEHAAAHRRRGDPGRRAHHRRRELQGVLPGARGPRRASRRTSTATAPTPASRPAAAPTPCPDRPQSALAGRSSPTPSTRRSGTRPARPARKPPFNRKAACHDQTRART